jgi:hypothetical protein
VRPAPPRRSVEEVLRLFGPAADTRLRAKIDARGLGLAYPPRRVHLLAFKEERLLELWVESERGRPVYIHTYPILRTSGKVGPKLREGDAQVPEGQYRIAWLHPNSQYHLALKLDYPNEFDRQKGASDGRKALGGEIYIHGSDLSIGCLAMGDPAIEELFVLAARVGAGNVDVLIAPWDLRRRAAPSDTGQGIEWLGDLYAGLGAALARF